MQTSEILAIASGVAHAVAYLDYNRLVLKGTTKPNGATWLIWSIIAIVSTSSYLKSTGDAWKSVIPLLNIALCIGTLIFALYLKRFKLPDAMDLVALGIGILAVFVWKQYGSATYANLIVQLAILAGFIPTWRSIKKNPLCEHARPWWIWTTGYILATIVVILRWSNQWSDLVYPANSIVLHTSVALMGTLIVRFNFRHS